MRTLAPILRTAARLAGVATLDEVRKELGRLRSAVSAVAAVEREERSRLTRELEDLRAIVDELYVGAAGDRVKARG